MKRFKNALTIFSVIPVILIIILAGCKKDKEETPEEQTLTVTTNSVSGITQTAAECGGNITSDGGNAITARGVCWSTGNNPTISNNKTSDGTGSGIFISSLTNLTPNTSYYVRAYATNSSGTGYGSAVSFTTSAAGAAPTISFPGFPTGAYEIDFAGLGVTSYDLSFDVTITAPEEISTLTAKKRVGATTVNITPAPTNFFGQTSYVYHYSGTYLQTDFYPVYLTFTVTDKTNQSAELVFMVFKKL
jgi:hypothetical protein